MAHAICANIGGCCSKKKLPFTEASCEMALATIYESKVTVPSAYDRSTAQTCLDAVASSAAACDFTSGTAHSAACSELNAGGAKHAKLGEPCNATCSETGGSGSCVSGGQASGNGGAAPAQGSCFTNDGLHCDFTAGKCAAEACTATAQCKDGFCGPMSTCMAKSKKGEACDFVDSGECADGFFCDGTSCTPERDIGSPCTGESQCASQDCKAGVCVDASDAVLKLTCLQ
jgi:hypothetical protein